ncbi:hypothetical protein AVL56_14970 [Alteromonas stellipolaris]|nr:hypothetical protein AVL56_14970 [Alteromonas stellipolaris]
MTPLVYDTTKQIYEAFKVGLGESGFSLRLADKSKGVVISEHGITFHDWNVIAGVYFKKWKCYGH